MVRRQPARESSARSAWERGKGSDSRQRQQQVGRGDFKVPERRRGTPPRVPGGTVQRAQPPTIRRSRGHAREQSPGGQNHVGQRFRIFSNRTRDSAGREVQLLVLKDEESGSKTKRGHG